MSAIGPDTTPTLNPLYRMQWEEAQQSHVLLYPEGMVKLNDSAAAILQCCDGNHTVEQMCDELERRFNATDIADDVVQFLEHALERGWLQVQA